MNDKISLNEWAKYRDTLSKLSSKAADDFRDYFFNINGAKEGTGIANASRQEVIDLAYALVTKYGEAATEVSCQMYDAIAALQNAKVDGAIPAETATYSETAKAVNGSLKQSHTGQLLEGVIQRLVKQPAADTMLHNAIRHGAEWAWVPSGDTCVFCLTLASRGWQKASEKNLKNGHAEHIHGHCDCQFAVRFDDLDVAGYNPEKYLELYNSAEGKNSKEKIKYLRRVQYEKNKEAINARKRELYKLEKGNEVVKKAGEYLLPHNLQFFSTVEDVTQEYFKNAKKGTGEITFLNEPTKEGLRDRETAKWINEKLGGNIVCLPEKAQVGKNPDSLWENNYWEFKKPTTINAIDGRLRKANKQLTEAMKRDNKVGDKSGVIIDVSECNSPIDEIIKVVEAKTSQRLKENTDVIIRNKNDIVKVISIKK